MSFEIKNNFLRLLPNRKDFFPVKYNNDKIIMDEYLKFKDHFKVDRLNDLTNRFIDISYRKIIEDKELDMDSFFVLRNNITTIDERSLFELGDKLLDIYDKNNDEINKIVDSVDLEEKYNGASKKSTYSFTRLIAKIKRVEIMYSKNMNNRINSLSYSKDSNTMSEYYQLLEEKDSDIIVSIYKEFDRDFKVLLDSNEEIFVELYNYYRNRVVNDNMSNIYSRLNYIKAKCTSRICDRHQKERAYKELKKKNS